MSYRGNQKIYLGGLFLFCFCDNVRVGYQKEEKVAVKGCALSPQLGSQLSDISLESYAKVSGD